MRLGNESPVGLATLLAAAPAAAAIVIFVVLLFRNGFDIEQAQATTLALMGSLSAVAAGGLRQWRAKGIDAGDTPGADPAELVGGHPQPTGAELEG